MKLGLIILMVFCASASAGTAPASTPAPSPTAATLEIGIIHKDEKRLLLWPMFSAPGRKNPEESLLSPCRDYSNNCALAKQRVKQILRMKEVPEQWFDVEGNVLLTDRGTYANNLLGGLSNDFLGFTVHGKHKAANLAVSNLPGVFAQKSQRKLLNAQGIDYGKAFIDKWKPKYIAECGDFCATHFNTVSAANNLAGTLTEYKLPSGMVLQYIDLNSFAFVDKFESKRKNKPPKYTAYLHHTLWRSVDQNGATRVLHAGSETIHYDCEGTCFFTWEFVPDVIEYDKKIWVVGKAGRGEVYGYFAYTFQQGKMKLVVEKTGGS